MRWRFLPRQSDFFDFFERHAALTVESARELGRLSKDGANFQDVAKRIKDLEHEADDITHTCMATLHKTFITPIDRNDIHRIASKLDDVIDHIDGAARQFFALRDYRVTGERTRGDRGACPIWAWILTIPAAALVAALLFTLIRALHPGI